MAKTPANSEKPEPTPALEAATPSDQGAAQKQQQVQVEDGQAVSSYSNFCRVTGNPEELIVDFGLSTQAMGVPTDPIKITQRIIVNYFTAKRLLAALQVSVQRHEAAFGVLETDIQKRVQRTAQKQ